MRRPACFLSLLAAAWLLACHDSTGPKLNASAYVGTWEIQVDGRTGCWPAFAMRFGIGQDDADAASSGVLNVVNHWWFPSNVGQQFLLSGNVDAGRKSFEMVFSKSSSARAHFTGAGPNATELAGIFDDPDDAFRTTFGSGGCSAHAVATHIN